MNRIIIPISRWKVLLIVLGSMAFITLCVYIVLTGFLRQQIFALFGIPFFGIALFYGISKLFSSRAGLIITEDGFHDKSSMTASRFVAWDSIRRLSYSKVTGTRYICVLVKDPERVIAEHTGFTKFLMRMNFKLVGTPVTVSSVMLKCSFDELAQKLQEGIEIAQKTRDSEKSKNRMINFH